jgi:hypothetical protein
MLLLRFEERIESVVPANNFGPVSLAVLAGKADAFDTRIHGLCHHTPDRMPSFFTWTLALQRLNNDVGYRGKLTATGHG